MFCYISDMGLKFRKIGEKLQSSLRKLRKEKAKPEEKVESVKAPKLSEEAYHLLESLFEELGPRPAASASSRNAARRIAEIFESCTDDVTVTSGRIIPDIQRWMLLSALVATALIFLFAAVGLSLFSFLTGVLFALSFLNEMRMKKNPLRTFFPSGEAANVHAVIEPEGSVERTVIFSAHHDTATQGKTEREGILAKFSLQTGSVSFTILTLLALICIVYDLFQGRILALGFPSIPIFILMLLSAIVSMVSFYLAFASEKAETNGAGDNLSGVSVVITLCRYFAKRKSEGKGNISTRLVFVSFDGEECDAEGSFVWYRDNSHILINPVNINFDGLYKEEDLAFLSSDGNGFVPLSSSLASHCSLLAISMGYRIQTGKLGFFGGATDAVSAAGNGIEATTLTSMASGKENPAHTADDTPDKVSPEALSIALSTAIKIVDEMDGKDEKEEEVAGLLENGRKYRLSRY